MERRMRLTQAVFRSKHYQPWIVQKKAPIHALLLSALYLHSSFHPPDLIMLPISTTDVDFEELFPVASNVQLGFPARCTSSEDEAYDSLLSAPEVADLAVVHFREDSAELVTFTDPATGGQANFMLEIQKHASSSSWRRQDNVAHVYITF